MSEPNKKALNYALNLLAKRSYSRAILSDKLRLKDFNEQETKTAIQRLESLGFLNDKRYADGLAREYGEFRKYGRSRIVMKLREKKISQDIIEVVIAGLDNELELKNLEELTEKHLKKVKNLPKEKIYNRTLGFLMRRGYGYEAAKNALKKHLSSLD